MIPSRHLFFHKLQCFSIIVLSLLYLTSSYAQQPYSFEQLDSLFIRSKNNDFEKAAHYAQEMLRIAKGEQLSDKIALSFYNLALVYKRQGRKIILQKSIDSLQLYATENDQPYMLSKSFNLKGTLAYENGNLESAFLNYSKALEIAEKGGYSSLSLIVLNNIALIKKELQTPKEALIDARKALVGFSSANDVYNELSTMHLIGELYIDLYALDSFPRYLDSVKTYVDSGIKKSQLHNDTDAYFLFQSSLGQWLHKKKLYTNALSSLENALAYFEANNDRKWQLFLHLYLGRLLTSQKLSAKAIQHLEKGALLIEKKKIHFNETPEIYLLLAKNYSYVNQHDKAEQNFKKFEVSSKEIQRSNRNLYTKLHNTYDVKAFKTEISKLKGNAANTQYTLILIAIICIFLIGCIALFYYRKNRSNNLKLSNILATIEQQEKEAKQSAISNNSKIEDTEVDRILNALNVLEETEYYLATTCTLSSVAKEVNTNTSYLSKIINEHKGVSFANYVNEYRVNKVLVKLKTNKDYQQYTLKYIAEQFGFSRHETFSRVFKKQTGFSPSFYLKKLKNDDL